MTFVNNIEVLSADDFAKCIRESAPLPHKSWPASRIISLSGGAIAENIDNKIVCVRPLCTPNTFLKFEIPSYDSLYAALISLGLKPVSADFITNRHQIEGKIPVEVRAYCSNSVNAWLLEGQSQKWSQLTSEAAKQKHAEIWDSSSRVSHQLRTIQVELASIAKTYRKQLHARVVSEDYVNGQRFADMFSYDCYQAVQNFLINACILRDYLAEFYYKFCLPGDISVDVSVTTMASLVKHVLNSHEFDDGLFKTLQNETSRGGWIKELGDYRDLVAHSVPLAIAMHCTFLICESSYVSDKHEVPGVICPLPTSPGEIRTERAKGEAFRDFENMWRRILDQARSQSYGLDGLQYAHSIAQRLADLAASILLKSPIAPKMQVIDDSMVIGEIKVTGGDDRG